VVLGRRSRAGPVLRFEGQDAWSGYGDKGLVVVCLLRVFHDHMQCLYHVHLHVRSAATWSRFVPWCLTGSCIEDAESTFELHFLGSRQQHTIMLYTCNLSKQQPRPLTTIISVCTSNQTVFRFPGDLE